jgi:hypothetical protein
VKQSMKLLGSAFIITATISMSSGTVLAQSENRAEVKAAQTAVRCETLTSKIDGHITKITTGINKQAAIYDKHDAKISQLITKAKEAGVDTTKAEANLQIWKDQTVAIKDGRNQVISSLTTIKGQQCADQKEQYKQGLESAKSQLRSLRDLQNQKKAFYRSTIKPDLQALRDQLNNL